jgi:hypothetical protein
MLNWELLTIALDTRRGSPLFVQLSEALANDIRTGRLKPGGRLAGNARSRHSTAGEPQPVEHAALGRPRCRGRERRGCARHDARNALVVCMADG